MTEIFPFYSAMMKALSHDRDAILDATHAKSWSGRHVRNEIEKRRAKIQSALESLPDSQSLSASSERQKHLLFLAMDTSVESVFFYLAALGTPHIVYLLEANQQDSATSSALIDLYKPSLLLNFKDYEGYERPEFDVALARRLQPEPPRPFFSETSLLLSSSGTTGSPKLIRLSQTNLLSNALSIIDYLKLNSSDRSLSSLPLSYSFGLSLLNTHLLAGASFVLTGESLLSPAFWKLFSESSCSSLAGVPFSLQILKKVGFHRFLPASFRMLNQAGGRLDADLQRYFHALLAERNASLFVMYGQTEATARMSYLPPEYLPQKAGSIGRAIPGGRLSIEKNGKLVHNPREEGEIIYEGPNVMLGYCETLDDLTRGDEMNGRLPTGDMGYFDEDGFFYISGRIKRISKVFGLRLNLDELEARVTPLSPCAVISNDEKVFVVCENPALEPESLRQFLSHLYKMNRVAFDIRRCEKIPRKSSGKIDYAQLSQELLS